MYQEFLSESVQVIKVRCFILRVEGGHVTSHRHVNMIQWTDIFTRPMLPSIGKIEITQSLRGNSSAF